MPTPKPAQIIVSYTNDTINLRYGRVTNLQVPNY
jgi:hypothetical protein